MIKTNSTKDLMGNLLRYGTISVMILFYFFGLLIWKWEFAMFVGQYAVPLMMVPVALMFIAEMLIRKEDDVEIKPFDFGDTLFFVDTEESKKFELVKGTIYKKRKEITIDVNGNEVESFSYKLRNDKGQLTDFIGQKFLSNDVDDILNRLNILGDVTKKYKK